MIEQLHNTDARGASALILLWMSREADEAGHIAASVTGIAKATKHHRDTVRDSLRALLDMGEVEVSTEGRGRKPHTYRVINRITTTEPQKPPERLRDTTQQKAPERQVVSEKITQRIRSVGIKSTFRATVEDLPHFLRWCRGAKTSDVCIYHIGMIAIDRRDSPALCNIADTVGLLSETGYIFGGQHIVQLPAGRQIAYTATRTGCGYAPRAILSDMILARDYNALRAIKHRPADLSATRALRNGINLSEDAAASLLRDLGRRKLIERGHNGAWVLTDDALGMVI